MGRESAGVTLLLTASCITLVGFGLGRLWPATSPDGEGADPAPASGLTTGRAAAADGHPAVGPADEVDAAAPRQDHPVG